MSEELYEMKSQNWDEFLKWWWSTFHRGDTVSFDELLSIVPDSEFEKDGPSTAAQDAMINLAQMYRLMDMDVVYDDGDIMNPGPEDT